MRRRPHFERHARIAQSTFGAHDALRNGGLRYQEGTCDLGGGQPAEQAQCERGSSLGGQQGMTGHEHQPQQVIPDLIVRARFGPPELES